MKMKKKLSVVLLSVFLLLAMAMPMAAAECEPYTDVTANEWYADVVMEVCELGLMTGVADDIFAPNDTTTRAEMASMIMRYLNSKV